MTFPFAAFTLGAILIYTAFKDASIGDLLTGVTDSTENVPFLGSATAAVTSRAGGNGSGGVSPGNFPTFGGTPKAPGAIKKLKGTTQWKNPDGSSVTIAKWMNAYLLAIGAKGKIALNNSFRTPQESHDICMGMCGAPSCPGVCAGRSSNHSGTVWPAGAIDLINDTTEPAKLEALMKKAKRKGIPKLLKNDLPADRLHYSSDGH